MTILSPGRTRSSLTLALVATAVLGVASTARATTYNVATTADPAGVCATPPTGCSLRQAIAAVNAGPSAPDVINLPAGNYANSQGAAFLITKPVSIVGAGSATTIVNGSAGSQVFVPLLSALGVVAMSGITVTGGHGTTGGGIDAESGSQTLVLDAVAVVGNSASFGGGIAVITSAAQAFSMTDSLVANNTSSGGSTGGIEFENNTSYGAIRNSTVAGNTETGVTSNLAAAGGISAGSAGAGVMIADSTISGNSVSASSGTAVVGNLAGAYVVHNSIIANGTGPAGRENCNNPNASTPTTSQGYNIEDRDQCFATKASGDLVNTAPMLGTLAAAPVATSTLALLPGSPAINAGEPGVCNASITHDQRQLPRPQGRCDIGAFEFQRPVIGGAPTVSGTPAVGSTLTCAAAAVSSPDGPANTVIAWLRDGTQIATGASYAVVADDGGHTLSCQFTAANAAGAATTKSAGQVVAKPKSGNGTAKAPKVKLAKVKRSLSTIKKSKGFLLSVKCDRACTVKATVKLGKTRIGSGKRAIKGGKAVLVRLKLTKAGLKRLKHRKTASFTFSVTATASGKTSTKSLKVSAKG